MVVTVLTASLGGAFTWIAPVGAHGEALAAGRAYGLDEGAVHECADAPGAAGAEEVDRADKLVAVLACLGAATAEDAVVHGDVEYGVAARRRARGRGLPSGARRCRAALAATDSSRWPLPPSPFAPTMAEVSSRTVARTSRALSVAVHTSMPSAAGTEQEAGRPRMPSISTRQVRHAPMASMSGSLQSCEMYVPEALMASSTVAPSGTWTWLLSILRVMVMGCPHSMTPKPVLTSSRSQ